MVEFTSRQQLLDIFAELERDLAGAINESKKSIRFQNPASQVNGSMGGAVLPSILAIEDNDEDYFSLCLALTDSGVLNPVIRCCNGDVAWHVLNAAHGHRAEKEAALILLDLNLPGLDGRELLRLMRQKDRHKPIIVLSTSSHPEDIAFCNRAGANEYLVKPLEFDRLREMVAQVAKSWISRGIRI